MSCKIRFLEDKAMTVFPVWECGKIRKISWAIDVLRKTPGMPMFLTVRPTHNKYDVSVEDKKLF